MLVEEVEGAAITGTTVEAAEVGKCADLKLSEIIFERLYALTVFSPRNLKQMYSMITLKPTVMTRANGFV